MRVQLVCTEGQGLEAEILLNGQRFIVMDAFSPPLAPVGPGILKNPRLTANEFTSQSWEETFSGNPERQKRLKQIKGWSYEGFGEIVGIQPTTIDFGIIELEAGPSTHDERCVGEFVRVIIDRLDLHADCSS